MHLFQTIVQKWEDELDKLTTIAQTQPQVAYPAFTPNNLPLPLGQMKFHISNLNKARINYPTTTGKNHPSTETHSYFNS